MFTTKDYLLETLTPAEQAKKLGLKYLGFGRWGKIVNGVKKTTHTSSDDKLVPVAKKKVTTKQKPKSAPKKQKVKVQKGEPLVPWHVPHPSLGKDEETSIERLKRRREQYAETMGLEDQWSRPPEIIEEANAHNAAIEPLFLTNPEIRQDIKMWYDDRIFQRTTGERIRIYTTINQLIDKHDLRVKEAKELYRGVYFIEKNVDYAKEFIKDIQSGGILELSPSGFTTTLKVAMDFANIGDPQVSVLLRALPPKSGKGFRAIHLSGVKRNPHEKELEVVTRMGKFQILSILQQETRREKTISEPDGRLINVTYTVQLQQLEK
jgi:hypothetical protein